MRRLRKMIFHRITRVHIDTHRLDWKCRAFLGHRDVPSIEVVIAVNQPKPCLAEALPLPVGKLGPLRKLIRHVDSVRARCVGQCVHVLHEERVAVEVLGRRENAQADAAVAAVRRLEDALEPDAVDLVLLHRPQVRHHVERRLVTYTRLLRVGDRLTPPVGEVEHRRVGAQEDKACVEIAVEEGVARVARKVDAVSGDGDVRCRPRRHRHHRPGVVDDNRVRVTRPHVEPKREQLAVEAHLEH
mmetsp:Transcript_12871/g.32100  ORF Transcript_12871/g.32100 Transcript_12871/m.32100 type:complete len:243 (+) Transcript_12871:865-1593(+)